MPRLQHPAIVGDLVLAFLGGQQVVRVDVLQPDEHAEHAGPARLVDEVFDLMTLRIDLDDQGQFDALVLLELDQPVEELLPVLVAGHVVVGDEERGDALPVVVAHDGFEIVGGAEAALAALDIDDGAERALERAAAAKIEARDAPFVARERRRRKAGRRCSFHARQVIHVVVKWLQRAVPGVAQHLVEAAFLGFAREHRDTHVHGGLDLRRHDRQHRNTARDMEAAQRHRKAGLDELAGQIDSARKLVGLDAYEADQGSATRALDVGDDAVSADARVGLVDRQGDNVDIRSQHLALAAVFRQSVERGQGIGGNVRPQPSDRIAVVVVMRGLDQHQLEGRALRRGGHEFAFWLLRAAKPTNEGGSEETARRRVEILSLGGDLWKIALEAAWPI